MSLVSSSITTAIPLWVLLHIFHNQLEEASTVRKMVQQSPARGGQTHRPAGWKRRRPRPRLSHKGPMPF
uniref:Apelin n=1 Tax=Seriola lalandi dorsalis TaxID=1841481 RepID=A0A3B4WMP6_SERLL